MSSYYPLLLNLYNIPCLVVGGGEVALRKTKALAACAAAVTVISPELTAGLQEQLAAEQVTWLKKSYQPGDCRNFRLVISATDNEDINDQVAKECRAAGILVNVVDDPQKCSFLVPAVLRRGELVIAVSTGGASPNTAKQIREELAQSYGPEYEDYLKLLAAARREILINISDPARRRNLFELLTDGRLLRLIQQGHMSEAKEWVEKCLSWQ